MYSNFATHFDKTRTYVWNSVKVFLNSIDPTDKNLLEAGCGNGKNLIYSKSIGFKVQGFDICNEFVDLCCARNLNCFLWNILNPIEMKYDVILCVAVIHHLKTEEERLLALGNLFSSLKTQGKLLITLWSLETTYNGLISTLPKTFHKGENQVPWKTCTGEIRGYRYYYIYDIDELNNLLLKFQSQHQSAKITIDWEEQNWVIQISLN